MKWKPVVPVIAVVCAIIGTATPLLAQAVQTSTLTGTIKDTTGAVLPGVTVNVSSPSQVGGVQTNVTDSQGIYRFPAPRAAEIAVTTTVAALGSAPSIDRVIFCCFAPESAALHREALQALS